MRVCASALISVGLLLLPAPLYAQSAASVDSAIPGRGYPNKAWSPSDLLSGLEPELAHVRARRHEVARRPVASVRGGGTMDIGEIAVLENDGTLVAVDPNFGGVVTDIIAIMNKFYETHTDEYDETITFVASTFPDDVEPEAGFAFYLGFAGHTAGINNQGFDFRGLANEAGGLTRLLGLVNMNDLPEYPADPTSDFFGITPVASGVEILGQEFEHAFGAFLQADNGDILGRGEAHWSFFLSHTGSGNASPMEGNVWQDNGDGTFTVLESFNGHSELDEYLMGLRAPANIAPFFLITDHGSPQDDYFPQPATTSGNRLDMTIQNIINLNGPRGPDTTTSMKTFKVAFILVIPQGTTADQADLDKINLFRTEWENYFSASTNGLGTMDTTLAPGAITTLPFSDDFNGAAPNTNNWIYVQGATISSLGLNEPSGDSSLRLNSNWAGGDEIRSRVIDLSGFASGEVVLDYSVQRTGGGDPPTFGRDLLIEYFNTAGLWIELRRVLADGPDQTAFTTFSDTLPDDALHNGFRLRLRHLATSFVGDFDDFFVDDLSLTAEACPQPGCQADNDGDCDVDLDDLTILLQNFGIMDGAQPEDGDVDGDGDVDLDDLTLLLQDFGADCN